MTESKLFVCTVAERLDLVVVDDEVAVWTEQVIGHQICIM